MCFPHKLHLPIAAAFIVMLAACGHESESPSSDDTPSVSGSTVHFAADSPKVKRLTTAAVVPAHDVVISLPGRIAWDEDHTSRISSPVAGRLDSIAANPGSQVRADQTLAYLVSPDIGSAQSDSARAQADLSQAESSLARTKELVEAGVAAVKDLEQAQADFSRARAEAARTELRLKTLGASSTVNQRYTVRSPIAGEVVERNTNPGMEWRPDQAGPPLFVVSDPTYLWCWIDAPESVLGKLQPGLDVVLRSSAWPQETFTARIDYVADALDPATRTVKVRARLRNPERHLKAEMYVTAELTSRAQGVLDIPPKAVFFSDNAQQVFVKTAQGEFTRRTIVPVAVNERWISIAGGLHQGDEVVVDGALYLEKLLADVPKPSAVSADLQNNSAIKPATN